MNWKKLIEFLPFQDKNRPTESKKEMLRRIFDREYFIPMRRKQKLIVVILFLFTSGLAYIRDSWASDSFLLYVFTHYLMIAFCILMGLFFIGILAALNETKEQLEDAMNQGEQQGEEIPDNLGNDTVLLEDSDESSSLSLTV